MGILAALARSHLSLITIQGPRAVLIPMSFGSSKFQVAQRTSRKWMWMQI